mgnify:CR=1 FL=1
MNLPKLLHPSQLTPELASTVLQALQAACLAYNHKSKPKRDLHIREFAFVIEDGQSLLDIYVEPAPGHSGPSPFPPEPQALSLDECLPLHLGLVHDLGLDVLGSKLLVATPHRGRRELLEIQFLLEQLRSLL